MKTKQTIRTVVMGGLVALPLVAGLFFATPSVGAADKKNNGCEVDTAIIKCDNVDVTKGGTENTGLWSLLLTAINILVAGVGVLALAGVIYGGVLYTSSGGNPEQVKKARTIITNVVIGVVAFAGMYALLNFLIPGGVFN